MEYAFTNETLLSAEMGLSLLVLTTTLSEIQMLLGENTEFIQRMSCFKECPLGQKQGITHPKAVQGLHV